MDDETTDHMTESEVLDAVSRDVAEFMFYMTETYKAFPGHAVGVLTSSLAAYVAIVAKNPELALVSVANKIQFSDWKTIRAEHFGRTTLGIDQTRTLEKPKELGHLLQMGDPRARPRE